MKEQFLSVLRSLLPNPSAGTDVLYAAVSGGRDSMCMLDLLRVCLAVAAPGMTLRAVHCNFSLRGEESDSDEALVRDYCARYSIPLDCTRFDTAAYAGENGISIEMAARDLRYGYFASLCRGSLGGKEVHGAVAVAHTASDNAETLVLNLVRGTGIEGICGMRPLSRLPVPGAGDIPLLRPLLSFDRDAVTAYVTLNSVPFHDDRTNTDTKYRRNLVRCEVLPLLSHLNPSILSTLGREMEHFREVRDISEEYFAGRLEDFCKGLTPGASASGSLRQGLGVEVDTAKLLSCGHVPFMLYRILSPYGFNESQVRSCLSIVLSPGTASGKILRSPSHTLSFSGDGFRIGRNGEDVSPGPVPFGGEGSYDLWDGAVLSVRSVGTKGLDYRHPPRGVLYMDLGGCPPGLEVRVWREGDWMRPLGMGGRRKKLSDIFPSLGIDVHLRRRVPLLCIPSTGEVLSILGWRISERVRIRGGSGDALLFEMV